MAHSIHTLQVPKFQRCIACHGWGWCDAEDVFLAGYVCRTCLTKLEKSPDKIKRDVVPRYLATREARIAIP